MSLFTTLLNLPFQSLSHSKLLNFLRTHHKLSSTHTLHGFLSWKATLSSFVFFKTNLKFCYLLWEILTLLDRIQSLPSQDYHNISIHVYSSIATFLENICLESPLNQTGQRLFVKLSLHPQSF